MPMTRVQKQMVFSDLGGGLATHGAPLLLEGNSSKHMLSPTMRNVDLFTPGRIAKRRGLAQQGDQISGSAYFSQTSGGSTATEVQTGEVGIAIAFKFTAPSSTNLSQVDLKASAYNTTNGVGSSTVQFRAYLYSDSAGSPNSLVTNGTSGTITLSTGSTPGVSTFTWATPPAVTSGSDYWVVLGGLDDFAITGGTTVKYAYTAGSKTKKDLSVTTGIPGSLVWSSGTGEAYMVIRASATTSTIQGLYDYRYTSASTQKIMAAMGGAIYYKNGSSWTSIKSGLGSGQDYLFDFVTLKDLLISCDYSQSLPQWWNGTAAAMLPLGDAMLTSLANTTTAGTGTWTATGNHTFLFIAQLESGGYKSSSVVCNITNTGHYVAVTLTAPTTTYGSDIAATGTKHCWVFVKSPGMTDYHIVATGKITNATITSANPFDDAETSFRIQGDSDATLNGQATLLDTFGLESTYFTSQQSGASMPKFKYMVIFQNMVAASGDPNHPSRVWFSEQYAPQIWSTKGGLEGNYLDIDRADGEVITGLAVANGYLYVFKQHSVHVISFTGNGSAPFQVEKITGTLGCLSHFSIAEIDGTLVFLSERGPCSVNGSIVKLLSASKNIQSRFDPNDSSRYNLSAMDVSTCGINSTKTQIWWGVSSTSATTRDLTLVYDWSKGVFWENDIQANYYAQITDSNFFPGVWVGDYSAQVFQTDSGTDDDGATIDFYFDTPWLQLGSPFSKKQVHFLWIAGDVQSSGTLYIDIYKDFSATASNTGLSIDMTKARFKTGMQLPIPFVGNAIKFRIRNSEAAVSVGIDSIGVGFSEIGARV